MKRLALYGDARLLLGAQWIAQGADGIMQGVLANELILQEQSTAGRLLAVTAVTLVPYSVIAPFMGVFVDRWPRRSILTYTNVLRAGLLLGLSFMVRAIDTDLPILIVALGLLGLGRLFLTTKGAALPVVFHEQGLVRGNALSGGGGMIAALAGGVIGIVAVREGLGTGDALLVAVAAYLISAFVVARMSNPLAHSLRIDEAIADELARIYRELKDGIAEIVRRPAARIPLGGVFFVRTAAMVAAFSAIVIIVDEYPDVTDSGRLDASALALGAAGVGAFLGAALAPRLNRLWSEPRLMLGGFLISGIGIMALGGIGSIVAVLGLTFIGGLGGFIAKVAVDSLLQGALPDDFRGRGFAIYDVIYNLASVFAALLLIVAEGTSLRASLVAAGAATLGIAVLLRRALERTGLTRTRSEELHRLHG